MLLALDIGNSAVKAGLFEGERLVRTRSIDSPDAAVAESEASHWHDAFTSLLGDAPIDQIGLASVVPARTEAVDAALQAISPAPVTSVHPEMPLPFTLDYDTPDTLGTDRLAAATAGWVHYGREASRSVIVVDIGTAVNYEVIHRDGVYQGGAIGPGPTLARTALQRGTAQLPDVSLTLPETPVGPSTSTALQSGIMWGLVDSVRGMVDRYAQALPDAPQLILTGGWSSMLLPQLDRSPKHAPHLVLRGVRLLTTQAP